MLKPLVAIAIASIALTGCKSVQHAMEYNHLEVTRFEYEGENWRIFDDKERSRMMTTPSLGTEMSAGAASGLTFGIAQTSPDGLRHRKMALAYMAETGRGNCKITQEGMVIRSQYEFIYECPGS